MAIWEGLDPGSWRVAGKRRVVLPILSVKEKRTHRAPRRPRPFRAGEKFDSTGWNAREFTVDLVFENSIQQEGVQPDAELPYLDTLNRLIESFEETETGDLFLPTKGKGRAKALEYEVAEGVDQEGRDAAFVTVLWATDNEESIDADSFDRPTVQANARLLSQQTEFDAQRDGVWTGSLSSLNEFVSEIEGLANLPQTTAQDLITRYDIVLSNARRVERALTTTFDEERALLLDPDNSRTLRRLRQVQDLARQGKAEVVRAQPQTNDFVVRTDTTLERVAASLGQSFLDLLALNEYRVPDPGDLHAGDVIRVFEVRP